MYRLMVLKPGITWRHTRFSVCENFTEVKSTRTCTYYYVILKRDSSFFNPVETCIHINIHVYTELEIMIVCIIMNVCREVNSPCGG